MAEYSYWWGGEVTGDASLAPYNDDQYSDLQAGLYLKSTAYQGVLGGMLNEFGLHNYAGSTVTVDTGWAIVDGKVYQNTASIDFDCSVNGYYLIVLRKVVATQTIRMVCIGPSGGVPALTQNAAVWEMPLAYVYKAITLSIHDLRLFALKLKTRSVFIPCNYAYDNTAAALITPSRASEGYIYWSMPDNHSVTCGGDLLIPEDLLMSDYYTLGDHTIYAVLVSEAAGNIYWAVNGGCWAEHDSMNTGLKTTGYGATAVYFADAVHFNLNLLTFGFTFDKTLISKGNIVSLQMIRDATNALDTINANVRFMGFKIVYTSIL